MNKLILLFLFLSTPLFAQDKSINEGNTPAVTSEMPQDVRRFNPRQSHWLTSLGVEGMKYGTFNDFRGQKSSFSPSDKELWGGRLGFGGEIYLGKGINTTTKVEGYYMGTLFSRTLNGGAVADDIKFAHTKRTGQVWGFDASQALGFLFDFKTKNPFVDEWAYLTVEPYVEAGVGTALAYNNLNYAFNLAGTNEAYKLKVNDSLINSKIGAGVNLTSSSGYFFFIKATYNRYDVTDRKAQQFRLDNGGTASITKPNLSDKIDPIVIYALGGGYKF